MSWKTPFAVYRLSPDGKLTEVFQAEDLKKAKYWLTYIAQPGDVLCKTPLHPKHSKASGFPEYWSHKAHSGTPSSAEGEWKKWAQQRTTELIFPDNQDAALPPQG